MAGRAEKVHPEGQSKVLSVEGAVQMDAARRESLVPEVRINQSC